MVTPEESLARRPLPDERSSISGCGPVGDRPPTNGSPELTGEGEAPERISSRASQKGTDPQIGFVIIRYVNGTKIMNQPGAAVTARSLDTICHHLTPSASSQMPEM